MGFFKIMIALVIIILCAMLFVRIVDEVKYSFKVKQELKENNATCYFDRGWFNIPLAKICTYNNNTVLIKRDNDTYLPRYGNNISVFPNGSWVVKE